MTPLRQNLEAAKREHANTRYPGDLAADVRALQAPQTLGFIGRAVRVVSAIAAIVAVAFFARMILHQRSTTLTPAEPTEEVAIQDDEPEAESTALSMTSISVPSWTDLARDDSTTQPTSVDESLAMSISTVSIPSFPSLNDIDATSVTNTLDNEENQ